MRRFWIITFFAALLFPAWAEARAVTDWMWLVFKCTGDVCVIHENKGGLIDRFISAAREAYENNIRVRIDGQCSSSCVVFASRVRENVCLTGNAIMEIHRGFTKDVFDPQGHKVLLDSEENIKIFERPPKGYIEIGYDKDIDYGADINRWAKELGKMPGSDTVYSLTWEEAMLFWKPCEQTSHIAFE